MATFAGLSDQRVCPGTMLLSTLPLGVGGPSANKRYHLSQGWSRGGLSQQSALRALPTVAAGVYLAEIEGLLLLEVGARPLLTVGDGS